MNKSESIGNLAAALAKAQAAMAFAKKDSSNPFFKSKYADLAAVVEAVKKPLAENELAYVQATDIDESGGVIVETTLMHSSGEWYSSRLRMRPVKDDPQGIGSCITYARRYSLQSLVGVPSDDDDGNASSGPVPTITEAQAADIQALLDETGADAKKFLAFFHVGKLSEIRANDAPRAISMLEKKRKAA